jgi:hypothetical protein
MNKNNIYYFITYETEFTESGKPPVVMLNNAVLKNIHPVEWLASPGMLFRHLRVVLVFWSEIPEEHAMLLTDGNVGGIGSGRIGCAWI